MVVAVLEMSLVGGSVVVVAGRGLVDELDAVVGQVELDDVAVFGL